jgi:chaperonin cofactor prefoldin
LIPRKHKEVLRKTIEDNGFDKSFAEDAVSFYWAEIRKNLSDLAHTTIVVRKLGNFNVKSWKVDEFIENYRKCVEKMEAMTFKDATYKRKMEKQYESFVNLNQMIQCEQKRKIDKKQIRAEYESAKTMGEQIQDNGGTPEQRNQEG